MEWTQALAPKSWPEIVGHSPVKAVLENCLKADKVPKFIIFYGPTGVGKSAMAHLLARSIVCPNAPKPCNNCEICDKSVADKYPGIQTFNMAKHTTSEEIRSIMNQIFTWAASTERTVFILEEVQEMRLHDAQSAFLEELTHIPDDITIIMCTTQFYRLDSALRNRAASFELDTPSNPECKTLINRICGTFHLKPLAMDVQDAVIRLNRNTPRSIVKCLEMLSAGGEISMEALEQFYSLIDTAVYVRLFLSIFDEAINLYEFLKILEEIGSKHKLYTLLRGLKGFSLTVLAEVCGAHTEYSISKGDRQAIKTVLDRIGAQRYLGFMQKLGKVKVDYITTPEAAEFELVLLKEFGLGNPDKVTQTSNIQQASIEREKAIKRSTVPTTLTASAGGGTSELKATDLQNF